LAGIDGPGAEEEAGCASVIATKILKINIY